MRGLCCVLLCVAAAAGGGATPPPGASDDEAKAALDRFSEEYRSKDAGARLVAIERLGLIVHPAVAERLARTLRRLKDPAQAAAACRGLALQHAAVAEAGAAIWRFLLAEAETEGQNLARGDTGIPVDPKTGDLLLATPEAKAAIAAAQARDAMLEEALRGLAALDYCEPWDLEPLTGYLQSASDRLVASMLGAFARWKAWHALPAMLELFRMYPSPSRWETGAVVDRGGTNASAKRAWMAKFGHPDKQRPRPDVVKALLVALESITGEAFRAPDELAEYLKRPEVRANLERARRSQPVRIDPRKAIRDAKKAIQEASMDELPAYDRDLRLAAIARHDHADAVAPLADALMKLGAFAQRIAAGQEQVLALLRPLEAKSGLSPDEAVRRQAAERDLAAWNERERLVRASFDLLVAAVGRFEDRSTIARMLDVFAKHQDPSVRQLLADATVLWFAQPLEDDCSAAVVTALLRLVKDPSPLVRVASARALGVSRDARAFAALRASAMGDADWRVRAAAVLALGDTGGPESISALIEAMALAEGRLLDDINSTLLRMTGWNLVYPEVWAQWWRDARGVPPAPPPNPPAAPLELRKGQRFYGIPTRSQRVLYVIDISGSMTRPTSERSDRSVGDRDKPQRTRLDVAQEELKRSIDQLPADATFSMIFFNHAVRVWDRELRPATREARRLAQEAVAALEPSGATFTLGALREAFAVAGLLGKAAQHDVAVVDTVFLLSDGAPTDSKLDEAKLMDPSIILEAVQCWNRGRAVVIHTIAIDVVDSRFLRDLAARNGGQFVERK